MTSLSPPVLSVLELFQGPLASVRFADIDAAGLARLAAEVEAAASEVREHEGKLAELRQTLGQRQEALLALAQQALAYARVYAENDEALLDAVNRIVLPRAAKPRKLPASKGNTARGDASGDAGDGAPASDTRQLAGAHAADGEHATARAALGQLTETQASDAPAADVQAADADAAEAEPQRDRAEDDETPAEEPFQAGENAASAARGALRSARKGRAAAPQRAASRA